jgi:hypothetical protein
MSGKAVRSVNGLPIPPALASAMARGQWPGVLDLSVLERVFRDRPINPCFYSMEDISQINRDWLTEMQEAYIGRPSADHPPGDIDPARSLLVGDLGPDQLIALDYRSSATKPQVIYAAYDPRSIWQLVAGSIEELLTMLGWG